MPIQRTTPARDSDLTGAHLQCRVLNFGGPAFRLSRRRYANVAPDFAVLAEQGGGPWDRPQGRYQFFLHRREGFALLRLEVEGRSAAQAGLAWEEFRSALWYAWCLDWHNRRLREESAAGLAAPQRPPKRLPWLAVTLLPDWVAAASAPEVGSVISGLAGLAFGVVAHSQQLAFRN